MKNIAPYFRISKQKQNYCDKQQDYKEIGENYEVLSILDICLVTGTCTVSDKCLFLTDTKLWLVNF